jgi:hypothetical protein
VGIGLGHIKPADKLRESVWYTLPHHIVVHGAQLMPDSGLNLGVKPAWLAGSGVLGLRFHIFHDLSRAPPTVKSPGISGNILDSEAFAAIFSVG